MANSTIIYACTGDGLVIFNKPGTLPEWLPPRHALQGRTVLAAWAETGPPIRVLVAVLPTGTEPSGGLLLSETGGREWTPAFAAPVVSVLAAHDDPARLYAGLYGGGLAGSTIGGTNWGVLPGLEQAGAAFLLAQDAKEPADFYLLLEPTEGGAALLRGNPESGNWQPLSISNVHALSTERENGDLYAAATDGVYMSGDRGTLWGALPGSPTGGSCILAIEGPAGSEAALIVGTDAGLFVSPDGGAMWQGSVLPAPGAVTALARDPERRDRLYAATAEGYLFESGNRGQSWQPVNRDPAGAVNALYVLRI